MVKRETKETMTHENSSEPFAQGVVALVWDYYGPYHHARLGALKRTLVNVPVYGVQVADRTKTYAWAPHTAGREIGSEVRTLLPGMPSEAVTAPAAFKSFCRFLRRNHVRVALLPSYWPASSAALLLAAKLCRVRAVMMNESHAATESARGVRRLIKQSLVRLFDAGLVGGAPHVRHFENLGLPKNRIFTGYDAVDNDHFLTQADSARARAGELRTEYQLPERYILSLGRLVAKKNLRTLVRAYSEFVSAWTEDKPPALVIVGSGEEELQLKELCAALGTPWSDRSQGYDTSTEPNSAGALACFYGFRQIEENPIFYALADVFVLPSIREEWGLVVNEAMASGLPVIVSQAAGCAEDLVKPGENGFTFAPDDPSELARRLTEVCESRRLADKFSLRSREIIANWGCENFARNAVRAIEAAQAAL